jgi:hypothetical protein
MAVSNQATNQIDAEVDRTAMASVINLGDVLQLVGDGLDDGTFT